MRWFKVNEYAVRIANGTALNNQIEAINSFCRQTNAAAWKPVPFSDHILVLRDEKDVPTTLPHHYDKDSTDIVEEEPQRMAVLEDYGLDQFVVEV